MELEVSAQKTPFKHNTQLKQFRLHASFVLYPVTIICRRGLRPDRRGKAVKHVSPTSL